MKRWGKWIILTAAVVGIGAIAGRVVVSQTPSPEIAAHHPLAELFAKAQPHLESVLGAKLDFAPQFRAVTAVQLQTTPDCDLEAYLHWHGSYLQGETLARTRAIAQQIVSSATVARYVEGGDIVVVATDNLVKIAAWEETLGPVNSEAFLQLALVHEVVRWHLDRCYHLGKLRAACCDAEEYEALQSVVEGRAEAVTRRVAQKLGCEALFPLMARRYLHVPDEAPDPGLKMLSQTALHARQRACTQGQAFFDCLDELGLATPEAPVFARLPRQMTVLARPDRWVKTLDNGQPDLAAVLAALESTLPAAEWQPMQQTWTPAMLAQVAGLLGAPKERVERVTRTWYEGRSLIWSRRNQPGGQIELSVVRHDDGAGARAYFGFALDLQRKQDALPPGTCGPSISVIESKSVALELAGFEEAVRNDKRIAFGSAPPLPVSLLLARCGNLVIECTWHGATFDQALAEHMVQAVRAAAK